MKLESIRVGKYEIMPKAFLTVLFTLFLMGVLLGAYIAAKEDNPDMNLFFMSIFSIPILMIMYKPIKKGIIKS